MREKRVHLLRVFLSLFVLLMLLSMTACTKRDDELGPVDSDWWTPEDEYGWSPDEDEWNDDGSYLFEENVTLGEKLSYRVVQYIDFHPYWACGIFLGFILVSLLVIAFLLDAIGCDTYIMKRFAIGLFWGLLPSALCFANLVQHQYGFYGALWYMSEYWISHKFLFILTGLVFCFNPLAIGIWAACSSEVPDWQLILLTPLMFVVAALPVVLIWLIYQYPGQILILLVIGAAIFAGGSTVVGIIFVTRK